MKHPSHDPVPAAYGCNKNGKSVSQENELKGRMAAWIDRQVGERLRRRRVSHGITQDEVADILGISYQQVQKYESGANRISAGRLYQMARFLNVDIGQLFDGLDSQIELAESHGNEDASTTPNRSVIELVRGFNAIDDAAQRNAILTLVRSMAQGSAGTEDAAVKSNGANVNGGSSNVLNFAMGSEKQRGKER